MEKRLISFGCNDHPVSVMAAPASPLVDVLRETLGLTGTKAACREGDCGSCSVLAAEKMNGHLSFRVINSCLVPAAAIEGKWIITIEGLQAKELSPFQLALVNEGGTQCGFCTPGFIISFTGYLLNAPVYAYETAVTALEGNICRCTGHQGIIISAAQALETTGEGIVPNGANRIPFLIEHGFLPDWFRHLPEMVEALPVADTSYTSGGTFIAGGTDIMLQKRHSIEKESVFFHADSNVGNGGDKTEFPIVHRGGFWNIAGGTTITELEENDAFIEAFPVFTRVIKLFGSHPIRSRATIGGNIVNASPIGDITNTLLALDAELTLARPDGERILPLKDFFLGYKKLAKEPEEYLRWIRIPEHVSGKKMHFEKVSKRRYLDIATVTSVFAAYVQDTVLRGVRISAGGAAPVPLLLVKTASFLDGKPVTASLVRKAVSLAEKEISPISDIRGSAEYKRVLLGRIICAHFLDLFPNSLSAEDLL